MNIFCVDSPYAEELRKLGHNVLAPDFDEGIIYLPPVLKMYNFKPDLLIQHERLSARLILGGLETVPCPTVFVSVDTHLNMFWHKYYARLFDVTLTAHVSLYRELAKDMRIPAVRRFAPTGYDLPFNDFSSRRHNAVFVGVLTEHRPARMAMVRLLEEKCGLYRPEKRLTHPDMLDLFRHSRLVPNESIAGEVNFRLFEGASCGALVISQNLGEDQNVHFRLGEEFDTYDNAAELLDKIRFYTAHQTEAEKMGQAAHARVQKDHLPVNRAMQLAENVKTSQYRALEREADLYFHLTLMQLARSGSHPMPAEWFLEHWFEIDLNSLSAAAKLQLLVEASSPENTMYDAARAETYRAEAEFTMGCALRDGLHVQSLEFNLTAAMGSLFMGRMDWARAFWLRQVQSLAVYRPDSVRFVNLALKNAYDHYIAWGKLLMFMGRHAQAGFGFRAGAGFVPGCAFECTLLAQAAATEGEREWLAQLHEICAVVPGFAYWSMGFLAEMSLEQPDSWERQMDYGLSCIVNYRLDEGLHELAAAQAKAGLMGLEKSFQSSLEAFPASGYILSALNKS